jgi:hypothetical protein
MASGLAPGGPRFRVSASITANMRLAAERPSVEIVQKRAQHAHRLLREDHRRDEGHEFVDRKLAVQALIAGISECERCGDAAEQIGRGHGGGARAHRFEDVFEAAGDARMSATSRRRSRDCTP